jgi:hypothetical protein
MIFRPELARKVLDGTKSETRRLLKPQDVAERRESGQIAVVRHGRRVRFRLGLKAVQPGRGQRGIGWTHVAGIHAEHLHEITDAGARREGCVDLQDFARLWDEINKGTGTRWADDPLVWVLALEGSAQWGLSPEN